jgi:hypothetical protein
VKRHFEPGVVVATPGAIETLRKTGESLSGSPLPMFPYLERHLSGDWGDVPPEDARENELSVMEGLRILSSYTLPGGGKVWIITEAYRSSATILLAEEY